MNKRTFDRALKRREHVKAMEDEWIPPPVLERGPWRYQLAMKIMVLPSELSDAQVDAYKTSVYASAYKGW